MRLGLVVEGHGEVLAVPTLVTRIAVERLQCYNLLLTTSPIRINRSRFTRSFEDFPKALRLLAPQCDAILVLLDSDDDEPLQLRDDLDAWAQEIAGHVPVGVALAVREYESWLLASVPEMAGQHTLAKTASYDRDPEAVRNAKGVFKSLTIGRVYSETVDQKWFSAILDIGATERRSPSFANLIATIDELLKSDSGSPSNTDP